jgi:dTDP-4-amino-4,6-dideoxygalactose transaminase
MDRNTDIPFLDLVAPHRELEAELVQVFKTVLGRAAFIGGPMVEEFEKSFAEFCGTRYSVAINSGTDALRFAMIACGIEPGSVVVTVPHTFIATTEAISQAGAHPEFVDIDSRTYNMSVSNACGTTTVGSGAGAAGGRFRRSFRCISTAKWPTWTGFCISQTNSVST